MSISNNNVLTQTASTLLNNKNHTMSSINSENTQTPYKLPASLEDGKVIKGEVIKLCNNEVTIKLDNNETITAPLKEGSQIAIGQTVSFEVILNEENEFVLKPILKELSPTIEHTLNKALEAANLPKSVRNLEIVRELLANQMSIDKQSILNILRQSLLHKNVSLNTLIFMTQNQIPITDINAVQLENCRNYEHRITSEINMLTSSLPDLFLNVAENSNSSEFNQFHNQFITALLTKAPALSMESNSLMLSEEVNHNQFTLPKDYPMNETTKEFLFGENKTIGELLDFINSDFSYEIQEEKDTQANPLKHPLIDNIREQLTQILKEQGKVGAFLPPQDRQQILSAFKELPLSESMIKDLKSGEMTTKELLNLIKFNLPLLDETSAKTFFTGSIYKSIIKEQLLSNWTLTPKELTKTGALPELYERMDKQLSELIKFNSAFRNPNQLDIENTINKWSASTTSLKQNIDFMKSLNEFFPYVQLPIRLKEKTLHSDLYVYTNKKDLKKNRNNISVLLHLDMDYLGSMDVHITLNDSQVSSKFYFEKEESVSIIKDNITQLEQALNKKGFSFQYEVLKREEKSDLIEEFTKNNSPASSLKRYAFDIKA